MLKKFIIIFVFIHGFLFGSWAQYDERIFDIYYLFDAKPIDTINTKDSEFGPIWFDNNIFFSSNREINHLNAGEDRWKTNKSYNIFFASHSIDSIDASSDYSSLGAEEVKYYDKKLNSILHSGPISFSVTGDTVFVTQVDFAKKDTTTKANLYRPFIYVSIKNKNGKYGKLTRLPFITDSYNFAHPSYHSPSQTLYFSSNYATAGDEDIFKVKWLPDGTWSEIENLGDSINTSADEMFPFFTRDQLFYASDRKSGFGGLDLYWSMTIDGLWKNARNLGESINTDADDFSFSMSENKQWAFFSSNRNGSDDIFYSLLKRNYILKDEKEDNELYGQFIFRTLNTDVIGLKVELKNSDGLVLDETYTDEEGTFIFNRLLHDSSFQVVVKVDDSDLELKVFSENGKKMAVLVSNDGDEFDLKRMKSQESDILSLLKTNDNVNMKALDLEGQFLFENKPGEYPEDLDVKIVDEDGAILYSSKTDKFGNFSFAKLPMDKKMFLTIDDEVRDDFILLIYNNKGNVIARLKNGDDGFFNYRKMADKKFDLSLLLNDNDSILEPPYKRLTGEIDFKKLDGFFENGLEIIVYDENSVAIDTVRSSETGSFAIEKLAPDYRSLQFHITDAESYPDADLNFYITNRKGEKIATLSRNQKNFFVYRPLGGMDEGLTTKNEMSTDLDFDFDDNFTSEENDIKVSNSEVNSRIKSSIAKMINNPKIVYFDLNSSYFNTQNRKKLNVLIEELKNHNGNIEISSYADSRADTKYNMWISENRSKRVAEYLISNGVDANKITTNAYGESMLKNDCGDGIECPEEMHQLNRRTEIILVE